MPKIKRNLLKTLKLKFFKFIYTQKELLALKEYCSYRINTKRSELYRFGNHPYIVGSKEIDLLIPYQLVKEIEEYQIIQKKVKARLAFNNVITGINFLIFKRENIKVMLDTLTKFTEGKDKGSKKILFDRLSLSLTNKLKTETVIIDLSKKIDKINIIQNRINKYLFAFLFRKSFVLKDFEKKRYFI